MTTAAFPAAKDPADTAWFFIQVADPMTRLVGVSSTPATGQSLPGTDLALSQAKITVADVAVDGTVIPAGTAIAVWMTNGKDGASYSVRVGYQVQDGSTLYQSIIMRVRSR